MDFLSDAGNNQDGTGRGGCVGLGGRGNYGHGRDGLYVVRRGRGQSKYQSNTAATFKEEHTHMVDIVRK